MGTTNSRTGGGTARRADGSSSTPREDTGARTRAFGGPATLAPGARSGANETVLPSRGGPVKRSSGRERGFTGPGNVTRPCSGRQQNGAAEEAEKSSALGSLSRDSDTSPKGAETPMSEDDRNGNATSSSKKRKSRDARSCSKRLKGAQGANATGVVVPSPDRAGKENTSSGHVADSNISKVQPCKPTDVYRQNIAAESSLPVKARDRPVAPARQSCLSSFQILPLSDETDGNSNICGFCGTPGTLRFLHSNRMLGLACSFVPHGSRGLL